MLEPNPGQCSLEQGVAENGQIFYDYNKDQIYVSDMCMYVCDMLYKCAFM